MELRRESIICPGCACLCDDLDIILEDDRPVEVHNICTWGVGKFLTKKKFHPNKDRTRLIEPQVRTRGRSETVSYEEALGEAAAVLTRAQRPLIYGLTSSGSWAQEAALKVARSLKARLEPADLAFMAPYFKGIQRYGLFWAPLEIIRDEADAVIFWGANPIHSCPRHLVRYSVFARGRFTERGVEDRQVAAVDLYSTEIAKFCHLFVHIEPDQELSLIEGVSAALTGGQRPEASGLGVKKLADFLAQASYGVIFCGRGVSYGEGAADLLDRLAELTARLNDKAPFVLFPLSGEFNAAGLYHMLLQELGNPFAPDFRDPQVSTHATPVDFREVDAVLVTGADLFWLLREDQARDLKERQVPVVALSPFADRTTARAQVVLPVALDGIEATEIAYRMDGLPLLLRQVVTASAPPAHQVLSDLALFI